MDRDDIIKMAKQAKLPYEYDTERVLYLKELERFAALVAAREREACAKICDGKVDAEYATGKVDHNEMAWTQACLIAIRARGEQ